MTIRDDPNGSPGRAGTYLPGSPKPANSSVAEGVDLRLSLAFRFLPMFTWRRVRRFQVWRVFDAITGGFLAGGVRGVNVTDVSSGTATVSVGRR